MGRKKEEREGPSVTTCEVLCLVFYFFFFFKYRKAAFGLNLKETENGVAVAVGRGQGALVGGPPPAVEPCLHLLPLADQLTRLPNSRGLCGSREESPLLPASGSGVEKGAAAGDPLLAVPIPFSLGQEWDRERGPCPCSRPGIIFGYTER